MKSKIFIISVVSLLLVACGFTDDFMRARRMPAPTASANNAPMIFGGQDHDIYLGNISLQQGDRDSIYNLQGKYGDPNADLSISNKKSIYGSATSALSACNPQATNPPILVNKYNNVLGDFTLNAERETKLSDDVIGSLRKLCKTRGA